MHTHTLAGWICTSYPASVPRARLAKCGATLYRICCPTWYATQHPGDMDHASRPCQCMFITCQGMDTLCRVCSCAGYTHTSFARFEGNTMPCHCAMDAPWCHPVQDMLPQRVCHPAPWGHGVRITTLPVYVRYLSGYGYPVKGM